MDPNPIPKPKMLIMDCILLRVIFLNAVLMSEAIIMKEFIFYSLIKLLINHFLSTCIKYITNYLVIQLKF
jgi:hypothetical protein